MGRRLDAIGGCALAATLCAAPFAGSARADSAAPAGVAPDGQKARCVTRAPAAMLNGEEPANHIFQQFPENRASESGTFADGAKLDITVSGCTGPVGTELVLKLAPDAAAKRNERRSDKRGVAPLVAFLTAHQDAFSRTPLGLPGPARALQAISEGRLSYRPGDKICFDKDNPAVVPEAQRCARSMSVSWSAAGKEGAAFDIKYQAAP